MDITFDISADELPIFLAEVDEHLQALDDILIQLEKGEPDLELVQTVFRSAHTIKGMSGMIGHRRMTDLTHALETALDGVRKNSLQISSELVNLGLEAVDCLRALRDEVANGVVSQVEIEALVAALKALAAGEKAGLTEAQPRPGPHAESALAALNAGDEPSSNGKRFHIQAKIDTNSMASAARAFQLMLTLQDLGEILSMTPTQAQIEAAATVSEFAAALATDQPREKVGAALSKISGIDEIFIDGVALLANGEAVPADTPKPQPGDPVPANDAQGERRHSPFGRRASDQTVRANVERLNNLMNLVGELITDRNRLKKIHGRMARLNSNYDQILETITHLGRITDQIQEEVMRIRMLPVSSLLGKFPRMVHDLARKAGKQIDVVVRGEETEMDRSMIEEINDPLIHLIRNAVDHGIETPGERLAAGKPERGTLTLTARHEQGRIILTVEDDGGGIDGEKLRKKAVEKGLLAAEDAAKLNDEQCVDLMFLPGLSTSQAVTDISGRGVGMDIVNTNVQHVNGSIQVETRLGQGSRFQIVLPLTLAIVPALLVRVVETVFAIPLVMITETLRLEPGAVQHINRRPVTLLRGNVLSLIGLADIFNFNQTPESPQKRFAVVVQSGKQRVGLIVDALLGEEEVIVKPLGSLIGDLPGISSAAILGDGQVALIVDVFGLYKLAGI